MAYAFLHSRLIAWSVVPSPSSLARTLVKRCSAVPVGYSATVRKSLPNSHSSSLDTALCLLTTFFFNLGEHFVLYLGETRDILCTAPNEDHLVITSTANESTDSSENIQFGNTFQLHNGLKGRNITLTAKLEMNNTNLRCGVYNKLEPMNSYSSLDVTILIQGLYLRKLAAGTKNFAIIIQVICLFLLLQ